MNFNDDIGNNLACLRQCTSSNSYHINRCKFYNLDVSYVLKKSFILIDAINRRLIVLCRIAVVELLQTNRDLFIRTYIATQL